MSGEVQQIGVLIAFAALLLVINIKAGGYHWTARLLKVGTYLLLVGTLGALVIKVAGYAL